MFADKTIQIEGTATEYNNLDHSGMMDIFKASRMTCEGANRNTVRDLSTASNTKFYAT